MGMFEFRVSVLDARVDRFVEQSAWVDTGALYSQFPASVLAGLGYTPDTTALFRLADGRTMESPLGDVRLRIGTEIRTVTCVFGEDDGESLLGATTLEVFRLSADPVNKRLVPTVPLMLTRLPADDVT
jgi:predicted aspartyl protease